MKETGFIRQNKEKWDEFEKVLGQAKKDPDQLSELFVQITDDLSYSRTFYPNRSVRVYLNNIAQKVFQSIYKNKGSSRKGFMYFWREDLPRAMWESRKQLFVAFAVFAVAMALGMLSSANDPEFCRQILGDQYVEMTIANIESGDPMAVYKDEDKFYMFLRIGWNNISIALRMFASGILFALGTLYYTIYNGIMVGAFQYFFIERGLFWESFLTIWMHGAFEISIIVISACAGLVMGGGLVFPGTYSRGQSFLLAARRGIKIMIGVVPLLAFAAFIEGYLTRYTDLPVAVKATVVFGSFGFILFYFVVYPWRKAKTGWETEQKDERLPPSQRRRVKFSGIKSFGDMIADIFVLYRKQFRSLVIGGLLSAAAYAAGAYLIIGDALWQLIEFDNVHYDGFAGVIASFLTAVFNFVQYFDYEDGPAFFWLNSGWMIVNLTIVYYITECYRKRLSPRRVSNIKTIATFVGQQTWKIAVVVLAINGLVWLIGGWAALVLPFIINVLALLLYIMVREKLPPHTGTQRTFKLLPNSWANSFGAMLVSVLLAFLLFAFTASSASLFVLLLLNLLIGASMEVREVLFPLFMMLTTTLGMFVSVPLLFLSQAMLYPSMKEITEANELKESIDKIGTKRRAYGLQRLE